MAESNDLILHGREEAVRTPNATLGEHFISCFLQQRDKVALIQQVGGLEVSLTYRELLERSKVVGHLLRDHGLESGDTVMLCCGNTLEYPPILVGTLFIGAALAPVFPGLAASDMLHLMRTIQPKLIISNERAEPCISQILAEVQPPVPHLSIDAVVQAWGKPSHQADFRLGDVDDPDTHVALIMCSSGTSGKQKSVEIAHSKWLSSLQLGIFPEPSKAHVVLNLSGPFWASCQMFTLFSLGFGHTLVLLEAFQEDTYFSTLEKYKISTITLGPDTAVSISKSTSTTDYDLSSLRHALYGGAPMSQQVLDRAQQNLRCPITILYGMTECVGQLIPAYGVLDKPGNAGQVGPNSAAKVVDIETGTLLGPNVQGELCFRSPLAMKGYRGNPQATRDAYDQDGFLRSGDVGYYDEDGYFYVVDRIKDIYKYQGIHVSPADIEEVLLRHPSILQAAVVGMPHETDCAHATAFVVRRPEGTSVTEQDLVQLIQDELPSYKWLYGGVRFMNTLPRTASGKVQKNELKKMYGY